MGHEVGMVTPMSAETSAAELTDQQLERYAYAIRQVRSALPDLDLEAAADLARPAATGDGFLIITTPQLEWRDFASQLLPDPWSVALAQQTYPFVVTSIALEGEQ